MAENLSPLQARAGTLHELTAWFAKAPRRRDFKSVPMILDSEDQLDHAALSDVINYRGELRQILDNTDLGRPWPNLMHNALNAQIWSHHCLPHARVKPPSWRERMTEIQPSSQAMPRMNESAPDFDVKTTYGRKKLSDYAGKWLVLFSHPADFTPVCTTEFIGFARRFEQFQALNCELLGLSIDSNFAHIAWVRNIEEKFGVHVPFPIIEDLSMKVAHAYGMIQPGASDTSAVRATFFIDPDSKLRAMVYYPMANGRSLDEFVRLLHALQTSDKHGVATPEAWKPGDEVIVPPPQTQEAAERRQGEGYHYTDWYFSKKPIDSAPS